MSTALTKNTIIQYIRNRHGKPIGVLMGVRRDTLSRKESSEYSIGWSLCNKKDKFDKEVALDMAWNRAWKRSSLDQRALPEKVNDQIQPFIKRCRKYFKNCDLAFSKKYTPKK